jgi:hypothetical protein
VTGVSIPETVLIFVGAPAGIIAVITLAALGPGQLKAQARYRPGRPWSHAPAWFVPREAAESAPSGHAPNGANAHVAGAHVPELTSAVSTNPVGGASGEW